MDDNLLQYLIAMGDLTPQEAQIARTEQRAEALRGMAQPAVPQQGRVASRMPGNLWFPALAGAIGGGVLQQRADKQREGLQGSRDKAFQQFVRSRQPQQSQFPQYPTGYGLNDMPTE